MAESNSGSRSSSRSIGQAKQITFLADVDGTRRIKERATNFQDVRVFPDVE